MFRLAALLCALLFASAASATTLWVNAPKDGFLNLRTGPSTGYHVIQKMPHASRVEVLRAPGKWVKLRAASGRVGWAHSGWLSPQRPHVKPDTHTAQGVRFVDAPRHAGLNLRSGPGTGYTVVKLMRDGARVEVLGRKGQWLLVRHARSGHVGYAHRAYLSKQRPHRLRQPHHGAERGYEHQHAPRGQAAPDLAQILLACQGRPPRATQACIAQRLNGHR
ncbi:SH3 domain-containing protein [Tropicibacter naphthalenivorans]|uniref:SH3 domain protein n=1 Tax=Tropicibacter naphthalenivorans TaxID=441103 RepID=A0A0P1G2S9_9RHOB|nr:SH3 domain-containing protein [Tropicibacter naphthalenivorans]CUH76132.1 SH3 domain protein [Tropicibacter naphthalenivorans]SMC39842.1 SH3 domain-containing protein [Tropicibacter naphthalenivorans]